MATMKKSGKGREKPHNHAKRWGWGGLQDGAELGGPGAIVRAYTWRLGVENLEGRGEIPWEF
jgi:hypothetical protein